MSYKCFEMRSLSDYEPLINTTLPRNGDVHLAQQVHNLYRKSISGCLSGYEPLMKTRPPKRGKKPEIRGEDRNRHQDESGPLRAVHLSRHEWPGGLVN